MKFAIAAATFFALVIPAGAQAAPADLVSAYRAGVAAVKCNLELASDKSSQLGDAVLKLEQKSGLAQGDLDALWAETETAADADLAAFCADAAPGIDKTIASAK